MESTHQCTILFKALVIFFPSSAGDNFKVALGDSRLDHVGKVKTAVATGTCTHHGVCFVNEQYAVLLGFQCCNNIFELFFKLAAIFAAGQQRSDLKAPHFAAFKELWYTAFVDLLCKTFDHSSFTHARIAYHQHIGFELAGQHSDHFFKFSSTADHWF